MFQGEPQGDSQKLGYQVLDVGGKRELSKGDLCLSPGSELTWLGTSEEGMVVSMDSAGLVSGLTLVRTGGWRGVGRDGVVWWCGADYIVCVCFFVFSGG